ncbi:hypothetical protein E2C01_034876 [Portunus trituberculatus]|uniref:Uncharacterized protein n=1 Tax=Portunus trituberculatus TaxID=210409 RepID=A0A5B7F845_PORTR|nr:hypothetical protein [Portunus trituberculatus]
MEVRRLMASFNYSNPLHKFLKLYTKQNEYGNTSWYSRC